MQLVATNGVKSDDTMYDDAIELGHKLLVIRTCMDPETLLSVDKEMEDASAFAFGQKMSCILNENRENKPPQLTTKGVIISATAFQINLIIFSFDPF